MAPLAPSIGTCASAAVPATSVMSVWAAAAANPPAT